MDPFLRAKMAYCRVFAGLTHKDVAERMGVSPKFVRALEDGKVDPRLSTIRRWSLAVGVLVEYRVAPSKEEG